MLNIVVEDLQNTIFKGLFSKNSLDNFDLCNWSQSCIKSFLLRLCTRVNTQGGKCCWCCCVYRIFAQFYCGTYVLCSSENTINFQLDLLWILLWELSNGSNCWLLPLAVILVNKLQENRVWRSVWSSDVSRTTKQAEKRWVCKSNS